METLIVLDKEEISLPLGPKNYLIHNGQPRILIVKSPPYKTTELLPNTVKLFHREDGPYYSACTTREEFREEIAR